VVSIEGKVEVSLAGTDVWKPAQVNQVLGLGDRLRAGENSRALVRCGWSQFGYRLDAGTLIEINPPAPEKKSKSTLNLEQGASYFFGRGKSQEIDLRTRTATGAIRGTEFNVEVTEDGRTILTMIEGEVILGNELGQITLTNGEQGMVMAGQMPTKTAVIHVMNIIQWALYYPAVLDVAELGLIPDEKTLLTDSLAAYEQGNVLQALAKYPAQRNRAAGVPPMISPQESVYHAALLLAVGQVGKAEKILASQPGSPALSTALRQMVASVKLQTFDRTGMPQTGSAWLAQSYYDQSQRRLREALVAARKSVELSPQFGFAWARVAELEFGFGRTEAALDALNKSLTLAPRNAQAVALKGFLWSAQNKISEAITQFDQAIQLDSGLANAWLGRGLCLIYRGRVKEGLHNLQTAATVEPQRALLRSYLGKAFSTDGQTVRAEKELRLAEQFDPADPTAWLYSGLMRQQRGQINTAVRDLEKSRDLNDNRNLYRSRMMLDQDRAVRSANLASVYEDAGMNEVALREASRAVNSDYANYSAHLFLANSYQTLRDPRQINLRYETPWLSEYLVANLLAPADAGTLSPQVSQQEYSRLFARNRAGFASSTEYLSQGDWLQSAAQHGTYNGSSFATEETYRSFHGQRFNNNLEDLTLALRVKQDLGAKDSIFLQGIYYQFESGDVTPYYDPQTASPRLRVKEKQEPLLFAGYHHEWSPGSHTLFLGGRWQDTLQVNNPDNPLLLFFRAAPGAPVTFVPSPALPVAPLNYRDEQEGYTAELQHLFHSDNHTVILGGRYQSGSFDLQNFLDSSSPVFLANNSVTSFVAFGSAAVTNVAHLRMERAVAYAYYHWQVADPLLLSAGFDCDYFAYPQNFRFAPVSTDASTSLRLHPKVGLTYAPFKDTVLRAAYTQSRSGASFDQSMRLEPVQIAGFKQAYRSLAPESVTGANAGERFETWGVGWDQKFATQTYLSLEAELLRSKANRQNGTVDMVGFPPVFTSSTISEDLDYRERNITLTLNQLAGECWSFGGAYRFSDARLDVRSPDLPVFSHFNANHNYQATLNQVNLFALFNHPGGFFSRFDSIWSQQANTGYTPDIPGDDFWQHNLYVGYRFWKRHAEIKVGLLNLADQNYQLNPLNLTAEMPRSRTLMVSFKFAF
jgi:tetratricopeptide (TPR) repeat protein